MALSVNRCGLTLALTFAILYLGCALLSLLAPQFIFSVVTAWAHTTAFSPGTGTMTFYSFVYGFCAFVIFGFIAGAVFAFSWNRLAVKGAVRPTVIQPQ